MAQKRFRNFSLVTYLSNEEVAQVLNQHKLQLKAYAYIEHNLEECENHIHLILCIFNNTTVSAIQKWFTGFEDEKGQFKNTFVQPCFDLQSCYSYLTHSTEECLLLNKIKYDENDIISLNATYFEDIKANEVDNLVLALDDMITGVPLVEIYTKYGRDFIVHYGHIKSLYEDIIKGKAE